MMRMLKLSFLACAYIAVSASAQDNDNTNTSEGTPNWSICNDTSYVLRIATASPINGQLTPKGWLRARPGECVDTDINPDTERYLYAESSKAHQGGVREWKGRITLCADEEDFVADITQACPIQGMETRPYQRVAADEPVTRLVEANNYGSNAYTAGLQRLLQDTGYDISRIDGLAGRRTSQTLNKFLKHNDLPKDLTPAAQIDALEKTASEYVKAVGLTVCNTSSQTIWTAVGYRRKGNWQSQGWWSLKPEECGQAFRESLTGSELHLFALQESSASETSDVTKDKHLISNAPQPSQFCIAESRFTALGRENCADYGYDIADFRAVPANAPGYTINLTDADFGLTNVSGLRR